MQLQQRQCVFVKGMPEWTWQQANNMAGKLLPRQSIWLSNNFTGPSVLSQKQALKQIGKEYDLVVFDATDRLHADSLGAIIGTIKAGGLLLLLLPERLPESHWWQRFYRIIEYYCQQKSHFYFISQHQPTAFPTLSLPDTLSSAPTNLTPDQQQALTAIRRVVTGHRRRPLVLHADRGRGKTAILGIAAADLIKEGKQRILVTAPSLATVDTLFDHAAQNWPQAEPHRGLLTDGENEIRFIAPDLLLRSKPKADLLIVDEAAAIPAAMLAQMLEDYSRIVFATTLHGYEGTGRGFVVRFQHTLDQQTPGWHALQLNTPVRWSSDDKLEQFSFDALLLNAMPVVDDFVQSAGPENCRFEIMSQTALAENEQDLQNLFGLMVLAHYRTRPADLQMLLDNPDITLAVLRFEGKIIACAWLVQEGPFDPELAEAVFAGERRLQGHLLPQSLLAHAGISHAGALVYQRIVRIAVHPAVQQLGLGTQLINALIKQLKNGDTDILGTSFAADDRLIGFWQQLGFQPARIGMHHDEVSGQHALMMLNPLSQAGKALQKDVILSLKNDWALILGQQLTQLDTKIAISVAQLIPEHKARLTLSQQAQIKAFAYRQRSFDATQITLWHACRLLIHTAKFSELERRQQILLVGKVLQQQDWQTLAQRLGYMGKADMITDMRSALRQLLG